jgi:hypothetical protein
LSSGFGSLYPNNSWQYELIHITSTSYGVAQADIREYSPLCANPLFINRWNAVNLGRYPGFYQLNFDQDVSKIIFLMTSGGFANLVEPAEYVFIPDKGNITIDLDYEFGTSAFENIVTTGIDVCPADRVGCGALVAITGVFSSLRIEWPYTVSKGIKLSICNINPYL